MFCIFYDVSCSDKVAFTDEVFNIALLPNQKYILHELAGYVAHEHLISGTNVMYGKPIHVTRKLPKARMTNSSGF